MNGLTVNRLLEYPDSERIERVLWIDPHRAGFYVIDINDPGAFPEFRADVELSPRLESGDCRFATEDPWAGLAGDEDTILPPHRARRDKAWALIKPLVFDQPAIFHPASRGPAVARVMADNGSNKVTLYRLLRRYWQRGLTPNALLPDYDRCGGRGKDKTATGKLRGRPPTFGTPGSNVTPEMRALFRSVVTGCFGGKSALTLQGAYEEMIGQHFSDSAIDERTGRQILVPWPDAPSLRQFSYWYHKDNDIFAIERRRRTPRIYDKDMRALLGSSTAETIGPGSRYQIDATIADVYLVSRYDRTKIVGRPVLYVVIDVFTRMIVGVYVGFEGPSWVGAMEALAIAAGDKVSYCQQFGIDINEADWPCQGMPDVLLGDRGELASRMVETLINNFQVHVENSAPYRADWKGIVEQRFRLLPAKFKAYVPGYIQHDFKERGGTDYRLDATLDIDGFTRIILLCVLYYNNDHMLQNYEMAPQMIADKVRPLPIELWEWGIARRSGRLRTFPPEQVRLTLLPSDQGVVTLHGIRYAGCYYSCAKAIEEHWFERARQRGTWKVQISYDPRLMDDIYLHDDRGRFIPCSLTTRSRHHQGRTLWEIDQIHQEERRQQADHRPDGLRSRINLTKAIKDELAQAEAMRPDTAHMSKRQRTKDIRENRREERRDLQRRSTARPSPPSDQKAEVLPFPGTKSEEDYSLPDITEYLRSFREEADDDGADK
ncbi:MAG: transposase [Rhodospirillaceae bacterium BRH_c57]|nr:MAG: transposase [Rhodospirillaceae bacterium BRH_c57]